MSVMFSSRYACCYSQIVTSTNVRNLATRATSRELKDVFGTLSQSGSNSLAVQEADRYLPDDPDCYDKEEIDLTPKKNAYYYKYEISKYARRGSTGISKALELFHQMKSRDRLTPDHQNFSPLIYGCAKAGYTKKAFELYEESRKYLKRPTQSVVTCLINACAESPFPDYGLKRLDWFRQHLKINYNYNLNRVQYHSAIKAYGKLGQLDEASKLIQEMIEESMTPDTETLNNLLVGCASNKESGSALALRIYKRMKYYGLKPDIITYRLLLRCIRDCQLGTAEDLKKVIGELPAMTTFNQRLAYKKMNKFERTPKTAKEKMNKNFEWIPLISDLGDSLNKLVGSDNYSTSQVTALDVTQTKQLVTKKQQAESSALVTVSPTSIQLAVSPPSDMLKLPNLLSSDHLDLIYRVEAIQPEMLKSRLNRIMLFGGIHGYLKHMSEEGCQPDNKTFSLLLQFTGSTKYEIIEYFRLSKDYSIKRDLLFYDLLLRHVGRFHKKEGKLELAWYFIEEMHKDNLHPNISTFEAIASSCDKMSDAIRLLCDIERCGFIASDIVINNLFKTALRNSDFQYLNKMIKYSMRRKFQPVKNLVDLLEEKRLYAHDIILRHENKTLPASENPDWLENEKQIEYYDKFNVLLKYWLKSVDVKVEEHPWSQFHAESGSRRKGFTEFVQKFTNLEKVKQEALERGESFGNLQAKAEKLEKRQIVTNR